MIEYTNIGKEWLNTYKDYELLGDYYRQVNCNQAFLCYENAIFLCADEWERKRILLKKNQMSRNERFSVRKTSIVIVSHNCCYLMQRCLESIRQTCAHEMCEVIVVENASTDGVREWLIQQEDEKIILLDQNVGFPMGCNIGVEYADSENDIFLLNNDTRMTPNALFWLRMGLYEQERVGACGCIANYCGNAQEVDIQFTLPNEYVEYGAKRNIYLQRPYEERNRLCGFAMLIKRQAWNCTQGMDEAFTPGYLDDDDISLQIRQAGYRLMICHNSYIYHAGSQNFSKLKNLEDIITKNYYYLMNKWGFDVPGKSQVDFEYIRYIQEHFTEEFTVLHVGAGCGATLARIHYLYPKAKVYGVEACPEAILYIPEDIEVRAYNGTQEEFPYEEIKFDLILCKENENRDFWKNFLSGNGVLI